MTKTDRSRKSDQFAAADAAIERAVTTFVSKFERMCGKWEAVASADFIIERTLLVLCEKLAKVIDDRAELLGPAELKLSNALADYRDSRHEERGYQFTLPKWPDYE